MRSFRSGQSISHEEMKAGAEPGSKSEVQTKSLTGLEDGDVEDIPVPVAVAPVDDGKAKRHRVVHKKVTRFAEDA
jgi:hypothetical protein